MLDYRLAGERIESGLMLYQGQGETPRTSSSPWSSRRSRWPPAPIAPRDYIFVVDISGSMHGFPLDTAKVHAASA